MLFEKWSEMVARSGDRVALWEMESGEKVTFAELDAAAEGMEQEGEIWRADGDSREFFVTLIAAWKRGKTVVLMEDHRHQVRPIEGGLPEGVSLIKQTCGASGVERSLFFGEAEVLAEGRRNIEGLGLCEERPGLAAISLAHSYGFGCLALPLLLGGIPLHVVPAPLPMFLEAALAKEERVFLPGVPAIWKTWWKTGVTQSGAIDLAISAGAPLSRELERGIFEESGLKVRNFYGTSETGAVAFDQADLPRETEGTLGTVLSGVKVGASEKGLLLVESDSQAVGADRLLGEGEFLNAAYETTDLVELKDDLILWKGSMGEAINVAGRKVSPRKIERALLAVPGVTEARVGKVPSPDFERFEDVVAIVRPAIEKKVLREALREKLESWEMPRVWDLQDG